MICNPCLLEQRHYRCADRLHCACCGVVPIREKVTYEKLIPLPSEEELHESRVKAGETLRIGPGMVSAFKGTDYLCRQCGLVKPIIDFPTFKKDGKLYYRVDCNDCYREKLKMYRAERRRAEKQHTVTRSTAFKRRRDCNV